MDMELKSLFLNLSRKCTAKKILISRLVMMHFKTFLERFWRICIGLNEKTLSVFQKISQKGEEFWTPFAGSKGNDQVVLLLTT